MIITTTPSVFVTASKMPQMSIWQINSFTITVNIYSVPTECLVLHLLLWLQNAEGICKAHLLPPGLTIQLSRQQLLKHLLCTRSLMAKTSEVPFSSWILSSHRPSLRLLIFPQLFLCCFMYSGYSTDTMSRLTLCMLAWQHFCCQDRYNIPYLYHYDNKINNNKCYHSLSTRLTAFFTFSHLMGTDLL